MTKRKKMKQAYGAVDTDGHILPMPPGEVKRKMDTMLDDPTTRLIMVIAVRDDELYMPILGEPSLETLDILEQAVRAYREVLSSTGKLM